MKRQTQIESATFLLLLAGGTSLRLAVDVPNFAPVASIALFAGFFFRSWLVAAALPMSIMLASDFWLGGYTPIMMLMVYCALALPVVFRGWLRSLFAPTSDTSALAIVVRLGASSLGSSCLFYLISNFGSWLWFDMYDHTVAGLLSCYVAALPFFRHTLAGDAFFAVLLFGGYSWAWSAGLVRDPGREVALTS